MNSAAQLPSTYDRGASAKRLVLLAVLLANLLYSMLAFAQIVGTGQLNVERRGHTATLLEDGKVLIVGGDNQNGTVSQTEMFDPVSRTSSLAAVLGAARTDHTATRLSDGRVLIIGGRDQNGTLTSTEIYNPLTVAFTAGPSLITPRSGHTVTLLADGKFLIAGGDLMGSAELYNPTTQSVSLVAGSMNTARKFHSAILASSGQVLIIGGVNAQDAMLNTAEVFDPASQTFYLPPTDMQTARAFATLKLLSDGKVQIIGGDAELSMEVFDPRDGVFIAKALLPPNIDLLGATLSTQSRAALFSPSISKDPLLQGILTAEQLSLLDRADQSITELPSRNQALVAGGVNSTGQVLNSAKLVSSSRASVTTDKTDYAPGQIVTITGTGFQPNEQVDIYFHEFPEEYPDVFLSAVANQQGNFVTAEFAPQEIDIGRIFTLTAIGQTSGFVAQTAFKDNKNFTIRFAGTGSGSVTFSSVTGSPGPSTNPCSGTPNPCVNALNNNATGTITATANVGSVFAGWSSIVLNGNGSITCAANSCTFNMGTGGGDPKEITVTFNAAIPTKLAFDVQPTNTDKDSTISPAVTVRILDASNNLVTSSTRNVSLTIGTNPSSGTLTGTTTVVAVGGIATFSNLSINNAGNGYTLVASSALPTPALTTATSTVFNINKLAQTINFGALVNKTYGDTPIVVSATGGASGNTVTFSSQTLSICTASGTNGSTVTILGAGTCTIRASQLGNSNYNAANNVDQSFTVNKATLTVTADNQSRAYGAPNPTLTATISGFANSETLASSGVTGTASCSTTATVASPASTPTYPITCTIGTLASSKYTFSFVAGVLTINKASQTITGFAPSSPLTYSSGGTFTLSATGGASGNPVIFGSTTASVCTVSGSTANIVSAGTCSLTADQAGNGNYEAASQVIANVVINKASQTIIFGALAAKTFGDADFTVSATGGPSGNPVTFSSQTTPVCTVSGNTVHILTAGGCTIRASQTGNTNYAAAADVDQSFTINKATPIVTVSGGPFTYNGNPHAATVAVTGVGSVAVNGTMSVTYNGSATVPTHADTYAVNVSFISSDTNYSNANGSGSITIVKASSTTVVSCPASVIYHGAAQTPCTAAVTGVGGLNQVLSVTYANNINAGTATASASFDGDANHNDSSDSKNFTIEKAASVTSVSCPASVTYNSAAQTPCTAAVTGVGGLNQVLSVTYANNINAGTATASASFDGDANHNGSSDSKNFTIEKAATVTTVTCGAGPFTYNGNPHIPCSASVTGPGLNESLTVNYTDNVNAGMAAASASYAESANYLGSTDSKNFTIEKAASVTSVSCPASVIYNGAAQTPCTAAVTGVGGLNQVLSVTYANNINAGTATASASFDGDANHNGSSDSKNFTIEKAATVTTVTCGAGPFTYNGNPHTPCAASVTGPGLNESLTVNYTDNVNAGMAAASASYAESANYLGSTDSKNFTIEKAASVTSVSCPASVIYNGAAQTPCTAAVTGVGGLNQVLSVTYANNINAGTATASASFAGDANHNGSTDSKSFTIEKASSTTTVTFESGPYMYRGTAFTATAGVMGVGGLNQALAVVYTGHCTNVTVANGCIATATFAGDANHNGSGDTKNITINRRPITVTADAKTKTYSESDPALTYQVTSGSLIFTDTFTGALSRGAGELVGTYAIQQGNLVLNSNYILNYIGANLTITTGFAFNGFYSPIGGSVENSNGGSYANPIKSFKLGSTIPVKFGTIWLKDGAALITGVQTLQAVKYSNATDSDPPIDATPTDAATDGNHFRLTGTDWHFNLSTKSSGFSAGTWLLIVTLQDGSKHTVWISIKK